MNIFLRNQKYKFKKHLSDLITKEVMVYDKTNLVENITVLKLDTDKKLEDLDLGFFFAYKIFPPNIMNFYTQWDAENRSMQIGDVITQQVQLPPTSNFSQKLIFGVKISEIIDQPSRKGFSYETLEGHVEKGISRFTIEEENDGLFLKIQTFSKPGNLLSKLLAPIFSIPYQKYCTKAAMHNVRRQLK